MKKLKWLLLIIVILSFITGCSAGKLSKEDVNTIALEYVKANADENNLDVYQNKLTIGQTDRIDKLNKWVVYINYSESHDSNKLELFSPGWVSISDTKKILGYDFSLWGGEHNPEE
jgi:hypothetical protein